MNWILFWIWIKNTTSFRLISFVCRLIKKATLCQCVKSHSFWTPVPDEDLPSGHLVLWKRRSDVKFGVLVTVRGRQNKFFPPLEHELHRGSYFTFMYRPGTLCHTCLVFKTKFYLHLGLLAVIGLVKINLTTHQKVWRSKICLLCSYQPSPSSLITLGTTCPNISPYNSNTAANISGFVDYYMTHLLLAASLRDCARWAVGLGIRTHSAESPCTSSFPSLWPAQ